MASKIGSNASDVIQNTGNWDPIYGMGGSDTITGANIGETIWGGDGQNGIIPNVNAADDDNIHGRSGNDKLYGERGNDLLYGDDGNDYLSGGDGNDLLEGGNGIDLLDGGNGNDTLNGGSGLDVLAGGGGDDILDGGTDADGMSGGAGNDIYRVDHRLDTIVELANQGTDKVISSVTYSIAGLLPMLPTFQIENLELTGSAAINGTGNGLNNEIIGNVGDNVLNGGDGNDILRGNGGKDTLIGGRGNDTFYIDSTDDVVTEAAGGSGGDDTVYLSFAPAANWLRPANVEHVIITATPGGVIDTGAASGTFEGTAEANVFDSSGGTKTLAGKGGNDTYFVRSDSITVVESAGEGVDTVKASVAYTLTANVENLELIGTGAIDGTGNVLNNTIIGNASANKLNGAIGNDHLIGGNGDTLIGGGGNDLFSFTSMPSQSSLVIGDFKRDEGDKIDLAELNPDAQFTLATNPGITYGVTQSYVDSEVQLAIDTSGDGISDVRVRAIGQNNILLSSDFININVNQLPIASDYVETLSEDSVFSDALPLQTMDRDVGVNGDVVRVKSINGQEISSVDQSGNYNVALEHGALSINPSTGTYLFSPTANYNGNQTFTYTVTDLAGDPSNTATVNLNVTPVNDRPNPVTKTYSAQYATTLVEDLDLQSFDIDVATNSNEATPEVVRISSIRADNVTYLPINGDFRDLDLAKGTLTLDANTGAFRFIAKENSLGTQVVQYTVSDTSNAQGSASLIFDVVDEISQLPQLAAVKSANAFGPRSETNLVTIFDGVDSGQGVIDYGDVVRFNAINDSFENGALLLGSKGFDANVTFVEPILDSDDVVRGYVIDALANNEDRIQLTLERTPSDQGILKPIEHFRLLYADADAPNPTFSIDIVDQPGENDTDRIVISNVDAFVNPFSEILNDMDQTSNTGFNQFLILDSILM